MMGTWSFVKVDFFPKALALSLTVALVSALSIAIFYQEVTIYLPYISEAGAKPPASKIFSIFLDITSLLCCTTIILRYLIVEVWDKSLHWINVTALVAGLLSMVGMSTVAAFPLDEQFVIHFLGAFMLFGFSMVYGYLQVWMSFKLSPTYNSQFICRLRFMIMFISTITSWIIIISGVVGFHLFGPNTNEHWSGKKTPNDEGFFYLFLSSLAEWLQTICFIFFYLTLTPEFKKVTVHINVQYSDIRVETHNVYTNGVAKSKTL